jgi:hypothetical protein
LFCFFIGLIIYLGYFISNGLPALVFLAGKVSSTGTSLTTPFIVIVLADVTALLVIVTVLVNAPTLFVS